MTYNPCENSKITYRGNGSQTDFTFDFIYTDESDVVVWLYEEQKSAWVEQTNRYVFAGPTIIRFLDAPPRPENVEGYNIVIGRRTNVNTLEATFYPGSSIRAQDLNANFEQLRASAQDGRCELNTAVDGLKYDFWGKKSVSKRLSSKLADPPYDTTYREDQEQGYWTTEGDTKSVPTTGAVSARLDPYVGDNLPADVPNDGDEIPGKLWINTDQAWDSYWEPAANAWIAYINTGPRGQDGVPGEPGAQGETGYVSVIGRIGPGDWDTIAPNPPVEGALYIAQAPITGFPGGGTPASQDALGWNGEQWINYGLLGAPGATGPEGPEGPQGPVGPGGGVDSVNGLQGDVEIGVEQLTDFAYYPASEQVTLLGPCVSNLDAPGVTNTAYKAYLGGSVNELWVLYLASNTAQNEVFEQLTEGDAMSVSYYVNANGDNVISEVACTFKAFGPNSGSDPLQSWLQLSGTFSSFDAALGDYPMVITSPSISNGFKPITTGQALIYDQTTEKWRPEDVKLNISALPLLP